MDIHLIQCYHPIPMEIWQKYAKYHIIFLIIWGLIACTETSPNSEPESTLSFLDSTPSAEPTTESKLIPSIEPTSEPPPIPSAEPMTEPKQIPWPEPTTEETLSSIEFSIETKPQPTSEHESEAMPSLDVYKEKLNISETTLTLPTYPFRNYLIKQIDSVYNIPVFYFNRPAYEQANPTPVPVDYHAVVLENGYLRLTFLPELGGRLYSAVIKKSGQEIFYHNKVVKPSRYGVLEPYEANWWLATGGMEWAYPTQEHGYRWGVAWDYETRQSATEATIILSDTAQDRVGVEVTVSLPIDRPFFTVTPSLINNTDHTVPIQFWLNAALSLSPDSMSSQTQFVIPTDQIIIHSRGEADWKLPEAAQEAAWPIGGTTDLRGYDQWENYLGFFIPYLEAPFMGAYNPDTDLAIVRLVEPGQVPGHKLFAFGTAFPDRTYTDDESQYFEIWGGINEGFWPEEDISVSAGDGLHWNETWWPLAGLNGLTWANQHLAIALTPSGDMYRLTALVSYPVQGEVIISSDTDAILQESFSAVPTAVQQWDFPPPEEPFQIQFIDNYGSVLLVYKGSERDVSQ